MTTANETEAIVIADNDRAAYLAARDAEKLAAVEMAKTLCLEHGIEERNGVNNAMWLERTILEQRQVGYKKGKPLAKRIDEWVYKCSLCK
jgi:hypothetical protein